MNCNECGAPIPEGKTSCPSCGSPVSLAPAQNYQNYQNTYSNGAGNTYANDNVYYNQGQAVSESAKNMGIAAYITWIGFIIALVSKDKNDPFVIFHLNQALVINILASAAAFVPYFGTIIGIAAFVAWIVGISGAVKCEMKPVPIVEKIQIIK